MKTIKKRLVIAALAAAGMYMGCATELLAQNTPANKPSSTRSHTGQHSMKSKSDASLPGAMNSSAKPEESEAVNVADDAEFFRKAYEGGLAEVSLGQLAQEKAKSEEVKNYGKEMVDEHTTANQMIANIVSGKGGSDNMASGNAANSNQSSDTKMGANSGMGAGTGTVTGSGSGSAGTGAGGNTGTGGSDTSTVGSSAGSGIGTNPPNDATAPAGTAGNSNTNVGSNSSNNSTAGNNTGVSPTNPSSPSDVGSTSNTDVNTNAGSSSAGVGSTSDMSANRGMAMASSEVRAKESYILSTEVSAEHKAVKAKLSKLSGANFDREYLREMVKSHDKMWKMVYAKSKEAEGKDTASLTAAQAWAKQHVDVVRHHKEKAIKLMNTGSK